MSEDATPPSLDEVDLTVLDRCSGPVLDVGCGYGRFVRAIAERGIATLGLDIADVAVSRTRRQGVHALRRSVFDPAPAEGRWPTVLLVDGNIGIGGDPAALLRRVRRLLAPRGRVIIEVSAVSALVQYEGYCLVEQWSAGDRTFCVLAT